MDGYINQLTYDPEVRLQVRTVLKAIISLAELRGVMDGRDIYVKAITNGKAQARLQAYEEIEKWIKLHLSESEEAQYVARYILSFIKENKNG